MVKTRSYKSKIVAKAILLIAVNLATSYGEEQKGGTSGDRSTQPNIFSNFFTLSDSDEIYWDMRLPRNERFTGPEIIAADGVPVEGKFEYREDLVSAGDTLTNIYFLVDTSDSNNRKNGIEKSKEIVRELLKRGRPHQRFGLGILGERSLTVSKLGSPAHEIIEATERNENFPPQSKTYLYRSIIQSIEGFPCLLYTSPSPRDQRGSRMPSSA